MNWEDAKAALQLLAEERVGRAVRAQGVAEDDAFERVKAATGRDD